MLRLRILCIFLLGLFFLPFPAAMAREETVIRVGWFDKVNSQEYNPALDWSNGTSQEDIPGVYGGYDYEYLRMLGELNGWRYQFVRGSLKETFDRLERGDIDLVCSIARQSDREQRFAYTDNSYGPAGVELLALEDDTRYSMNDFAGFNGMRVGVQSNSNSAYMLQDFCARNNISVQTVYYPGSREAMEALYRGEIDGAVDSTTSMFSGCKTLARMREQKVYFVANKNNPELVRQLDDAIMRIQYLKPGYNEALSYKYFYTQHGTSLSLSTAEREWLEERVASGRPVLVSYDSAWFPIEYKDPETGQMAGVMASIFERIHKLTGLQFEFVTADTYAETTQQYDGRADVASTLSTDFSWADMHGAWLTQSVFEVPIFVISLRELESGDRVAVPRGYHLGKAVMSFLDRHEETAAFSYYDTMDECIEAVRRGDADRTYVNVYELNYAISQNRLDAMKIQAVPGFSEPTSIGVSKNADPMLFAVLCQALRAIPQSEVNSIILNNTNSKPQNSLMNIIYAHPIGSMAAAAIIVLMAGGMAFFYISNRRNEALRLQLEKANKAKTEFLSRMSHDIRTPMNAIIGLADMDEKLHPDSPSRDAIRKISSSSEFLLSLINDILDISKIESNSFTLHREHYGSEDFQEFIRQSIEPLAAKKGVGLSMKFDEKMPKSIYIDRLRFNQIFINLLGNAIKFTPAGGSVSLAAIWTGQHMGKQQLEFRVQDTGIGISREFLPHIFQPFDQENERHTKAAQGTGLGLTIVKHIVDALGGTIEVQSKKGKGSTFIVRLVVDTEETGETEKSVLRPVTGENADRQAAEPSQTKSVECLRGRHILFVEDNAINQEVGKAQLEYAGASCDLAGNGQEALEVFDSHPEGHYDAILMDIRMPVMDGLEAARRIRGMKRSDAKSIPIIALTADAFVDAQQQIMECGMTGYLSKPVHPERLYAALCKALKLS